MMKRGCSTCLKVSEFSAGGACTPLYVNTCWCAHIYAHFANGCTMTSNLQLWTSMRESKSEKDSSQAVLQTAPSEEPLWTGSSLCHWLSLMITPSRISRMTVLFLQFLRLQLMNTKCTNGAVLTGQWRGVDIYDKSSQCTSESIQPCHKDDPEAPVPDHLLGREYKEWEWRAFHCLLCLMLPYFCCFQEWMTANMKELMSPTM